MEMSCSGVEANNPEEIPLIIPAPLHTLLENDCIEITQKNKLVKLPAVLSVETLLKDYYYHMYSQNNTNDDPINYSLLAEVLDGIKIYFDFTLKDHLLHNDIEMGQYEHMLTVGHVTSNGIDNEGVGPIRPAPPTPSSVYGPIHLLRLFVKFPMFLSRSKIPPKHLVTLYHYFKDFLAYLSTNLDIFSHEYIAQ